MKSRGSAATSEVVAIGAVDGGGDLEIVTSIEGRRGAHQEDLRPLVSIANAAETDAAC